MTLAEHIKKCEQCNGAEGTLEIWAYCPIGKALKTAQIAERAGVPIKRLREENALLLVKIRAITKLCQDFARDFDSEFYSGQFNVVRMSEISKAFIRRLEEAGLDRRKETSNSGRTNGRSKKSRKSGKAAGRRKPWRLDI